MRRTALPLLLATALALTACGGGNDPSPGGGSASGPPQDGGELVVLEDVGHGGSWPTGLDPATNTTGGSNLDLMQSVYGGLFLMAADDDGSNGRIQPNQAESATVSPDGLTLTVSLREGIEFSDGTPLDAQAVVTNWQRDLSSSCSCKPTWKLADPPFAVVDPLTVEVHFATPTAAALANFPTANFNWIASPAALQRLGGEAFKVQPVGAGPFTVVSDQLNSSLVLAKNPTYFKKGLPHLEKLTFQSIGGDQPAYTALQAGQAQAYIGLSTPPLMEQAQADGRVQTTVQPATSPYVVQLNTKAAPFDDERVRQAIYAATDWKAIDKGLFKDEYPITQSFIAPGGRFFQEEVAGYQGHDLALAKKLVQEAGGVRVRLETTSSYLSEQLITALQTQWEKAGMEVTIDHLQLNQAIQNYQTGNWQAYLGTAGSWDPAAGTGVGFRFSSTSPFSGISDPTLDGLLDQASAQTDDDAREDLYRQAAERIADQHYAPFGMALVGANLAVQGVHGPGLTTKIPALAVTTIPLWDQVWREQG